MITTVDIRILAEKLDMRRVASRLEYRGTCPNCGYKDTLILRRRNDRTLAWCANCQDKAAMTRLLAGHELRSGFPSSSRSDDPTSSRIAIARRIWNASQPIANTPAAIYLRRRGVGILETSSALRFSPACRHQNGEYHAAMIAAVTSSNGEITAIHRTFITPDGRKAQLDPVKSTLGFVSGGAIRLAPAAETMCVAEGIETAGSASIKLGLPTWAAVSAGNMARSLYLPASVRTIIIASDNDPPGQNAADAAAARWAAEGRHVEIAVPKPAGCDFNDLLMREKHNG